jgi:glycosyltransferase involved in cell wall biosynthesis
MNKYPEISVVIPFLNEEGSLDELYKQLTNTLVTVGKSYEIIFIDDGSTDTSFDIVSRLHQEDEHIEVQRFRRNFGKAAALQAGFNVANGSLIFTMDADLQDSPSEIPRFLEKLEEGYDVVSGWKQVRHDPIGKTAPSKLFNWVTQKVSGIEIHDFNCGFKVYRREVLDHINLYGELHRYIPVLAGWKGFSVGEIPVEHKAREHGESKYGVERMLKGMFDLLTILFTRKYERRPLHLFGLLGFLSAVVGGLALFYLTILWLFGLGPIGTRPLLFFGVLAVILGVQLVSFGLLAEMLVKVESRFEQDFVISSRLSHRPVNPAD